MPKLMGKDEFGKWVLEIGVLLHFTVGNHERTSQHWNKCNIHINGIFIYLFICGVLNETVSSSGYIVSNDKITVNNKLKNIERTFYGLVWNTVLPRVFMRMEWGKPRIAWVRDRDSNRLSSKYKSDYLRQLVRRFVSNSGLRCVWNVESGSNNTFFSVMGI
jgi:hypothetical protein